MYETLTRYSDVLLQELQACKSMVPHLHKLDVLLWALQAAETLDAAEAEAAPVLEAGLCELAPFFMPHVIGGATVSSSAIHL